MRGEKREKTQRPQIQELRRLGKSYACVVTSTILDRGYVGFPRRGHEKKRCYRRGEECEVCNDAVHNNYCSTLNVVPVIHKKKVQGNKMPIVKKVLSAPKVRPKKLSSIGML